MTGVDDGVVATLVDVTKRYPGVTALDRVNLTLKSGEIHGLVGENGAGKSTLIRIVGGIHQADSGTFAVAGAATPVSPRAAIAAGIAVVHQEPTLVPALSVAENVLPSLVLENARSLIRGGALAVRATQLLRDIAPGVDSTDSVARLSRAQRQLVEIARAIGSRARILLLDEPTASISATESQTLHETLERLRDAGVAILYVSHKIDEILRLCDVVTVLRDGQNAGPQRTPASDLDANEVISRMVGNRDALPDLPARVRTSGRPILRADGLTSKYSPVPISFELQRGEILGWYGLVGSGRTEAARVLAGIDGVESGHLDVDGAQFHPTSVSDALNTAGIAYVSEDRHGEGLFLMHSISRNVGAAIWARFGARFGLISAARERETASEYVTKLAMKATSVSQVVGTLSGGTQQKVSLSKWLAARPKVLIVDEPTVGIDVRTKFDIHSLLAELANQGLGVIVVSSDLPEVIRVADRILVFRASQVVASIANSKEYGPMSAAVMRAIQSPT